MSDEETQGDAERGEGKDRTELEREHSRREEANPGNISEDAEPHHTLSNPAENPDETSDSDPYEKGDESAPAGG